MKTRIVLLAVFIFSLSFFNCSSSDSTAESTSVSTDDVALIAKIDSSLEDIDAIIEDQYGAQQISARTDVYRKSILPSCATISTILTNNTTWTRIINFGTDGCELANGNTIKGKIILTFTNDFSNSTHSISYTFENFYHNDKLIQGNKTTIFSKKTTDLLNEVHPVLSNSIDMSVTFDDGKIYSIIGTRTREMVEGFNTPLEWFDNIFLVTGNSTITKKDGTVITCEITSPLRIKMSCKSPIPVSGTKTINKNDSTVTLNFGNGECDRLATITKDGVTTEITLNK